MRKLILALMMLVPVAMTAQTSASAYLAGAVPEEGGLVTFTQTFDVTGKTKADIAAALSAYVKTLVANARQDLRTRVTSEEGGTIVARVEEIMTFKKKFLNWDHTYFRYLITAEALSDTQARVTIRNISYYYGFDQEGNNGEEYKAEEWIADRVAINKAGTKLYPRSKKFRMKTVDRAQEIFSEIESALK